MYVCACMRMYCMCVGPEVSSGYGLQGMVWFPHMLRTLMSWRHTKETKDPEGSPGEATLLMSQFI